MYAISFMVMINLLSFLFISANLLGYSLKKMPLVLIFCVIIGIPIVMIFFLYRLFIREKKYLLLCEKDKLIIDKYFGLSARAVTLLYIGMSLFAFVIAMLLFIKEN